MTSLSRDVLMTSIALPILKNGQAVGVVAGDLDLRDLERYINRIAVPLGGRIAVLSTNRLYVYSADKRLLGKPAARAGPGGALLDDPVLGEILRIETPINFPGIDAHWVVQLDVPLARAMAGTRRLELVIVLAALAAIAVLAWYVRRAAHRIVGVPLEAIRTDMVALAEGDLSQGVQPDPGSREIAQMQAALQVFRDNAIAKQRVEEEQARALAAIGQSLEQIARGDLTASLGGRFDGDFRKLQSDFNTAMHRVSGAFAAVSVSSRAVNAGADDIQASSRDLADRTERQATGLTHMSQAMEDITGQAQQATSSAHQASTVIGQFREEIQAGGAVIRQAITSMNAMRRSSSEIAEIIGVIEGSPSRPTCSRSTPGWRRRAPGRGARLCRGRRRGQGIGRPIITGGQRREDPDQHQHRPRPDRRRFRRQHGPDAGPHHRADRRDQRSGGDHLGGQRAAIGQRHRRQHIGADHEQPDAAERRLCG
jgi:hypothetical protein